ncbi:GNAT family N-acetyltransferase [Peribacillus alkalitolerans]|uniref:GNAT family N-acetyltransferase n=1 Tax=Peribacillus alkalitolerans TaxID=1550385 RepID=UPI0013D17A25|nr:GNAT family N-acetyltransferase [Peribacillus alkalitolerans]
MNVTLEVISIDQKETLKNLYALYLHDLSLYSDELAPNKEGLFEFDAFEQIWEKDGINPYLIKADDKLAGFVLLLGAPLLKKVDYCINDFFILNAYRGKGVGKSAARQIFNMCKGDFFIEQLLSNLPAVHFWKKLYLEMGINFKEETKERTTSQTFQNT